MVRKMRKRMLPVLLFFVVAGATATTTAMAHGEGKKKCLAPNGFDDTEPLQAALDRCSGSTHHCVVDLCAGVFLTEPLRVGDFRGVLRGAGSERTVLRARPDLVVSDNPGGFILDDPLDPRLAPWPFLVQFVGGKGRIEDLAVEVPTPEDGLRPTRGWVGFPGTDPPAPLFELAGAVLITGKSPVDFEIKRILVTAGDDPASSLETTLLAGVYFQGLLLDPDDPGTYPVFPLSGRYRVSDSEFVGMVSGTPLAELADAEVTLSHNRYHSALALDVLDAARTHVRISKNRWETWFRGVQVLLNIDGRPSEDNRFTLYRNRGAIGADGDGFFFQDPFFLDPSDPRPGNTTVKLIRNRLVLGTAAGPSASGVTVVGAGTLRVWRNKLKGRASTGIGTDRTANCLIAKNDLEHLDTGGGPHVALGPSTSGCLVVVGPDDIVLDEGDGNKVFRR